MEPKNSEDMSLLELQGVTICSRSRFHAKYRAKPRTISTSYELPRFPISTSPTEFSTGFLWNRHSRPLWPKTPPTIPSNDRHIDPKVLALTFKDIVGPAPIVQRPYDTLNNPYPYGCSKLCNHPIDTELRRAYTEVLERAKENWAMETRSLLLPDEEDAIREGFYKSTKSDGPDVNDNFESRKDNLQRSLSSDDSAESDFESVHFEEDEDKIPEELLLKYTNPDHDPQLKPEENDCKTDQTSSKDTNSVDKQVDDRKHIILDLRRESKTLLNEPSKRSSTPPDGKPETTDNQQGTSKDNKGKKPLSMQSNSHSGDEKTPKISSGDAASMNDSQNGLISDDANKLVKKLGKRRVVKPKVKAESFIECDFVPLEPEQTQVQTEARQGLEGLGFNHLGPLHPLRATALRDIRRKFSNDLDIDNPIERQALLALEAQMESDSVESKFDAWNLEESEDALTKKLALKLGRDVSKAREEIGNLALELGLHKEDKHDEDENRYFWLSLPRVFSFRSSRFELPVSISQLADMSPVEYLSRHVAITPARRHLYNQVFVRHRSLKDGLLTDETTIKALDEVMGGKLTPTQQGRIWESLGIVLKPHIVTAFEYKEFAGIAAFVERMLGPEFSSMSDSSKSEIEIADFDRLLSKLEPLRMRSASLKALLITIRNSGMPTSPPLDVKFLRSRAGTNKNPEMVHPTRTL